MKQTTDAVSGLRPDAVSGLRPDASQIVVAYQATCI